MTFGVYTVFNKLDGYSNDLVLCRSDSRASRDFVAQVETQNESIKAKNGSTKNYIRLDDYELRHIADFDDTTSTISPLKVPVVVPFVLSDSPES